MATIETITTCACGCGQAPRPGRGYLQGHDARHQDQLIPRARVGDHMAAAELEVRGWEYRFGKRWDQT
jgi:hypothetical protein